jgi:AcrR family transcriptional regulator
VQVTYKEYATYTVHVPSRLQQARADETRLALLRAARELFTENGYAHTSTEQVVERAGVTRGALYHHFDSKQALFEAVFIELEGEFVEVGTTVYSPDASAWDNLVAGCRAFLDTCLRPDIGRIVLLDGPSVLGPERWRAIEDEYALSAVLFGLEGAMGDGVVPKLPPVPLARMLLAAINEAGLIIAQSARPRVARREAGEALDVLLDGIRARP